MSTSLPSIPEALRDPFAKAISDKIHEAMEAEIKDAQAKLAERVRASVGQIACVVLNNLSFERSGGDLVIRVKFNFDDPKTKP